MTSLREIFTTNMKKQRQQIKLSQEALAWKAGLHRTYVSEVERGMRNISIDNIEKIAEALEVDAYLLLKEEE